ncbi:MAG: amidohydrolase [Crocinitomicaceae bacterium]|nr:amidohydrolase [Crocinitomicaceae bacterium]MDP4867928.1 amidohydrolase [Crocinitomicaceae bacterium]
MKKVAPFIVLVFLLSACMKGEKVDLIVHNAKIHTLDQSNTVHDAIAIRNGKIVEVGPERQILNKYRSDETLDAQGKEMYPGLTDAHGHMLMYAKQLLGIDLRGVRSELELMHRCEQYKAKHPNLKFVLGQGWDQTLWAGQQMPTNVLLNRIFPNIPVCLYRIDGHAALVNDYLIKKSMILDHLDGLSGGEVVFHKSILEGNLSFPEILNLPSDSNFGQKIILQTYKPTGLLIDNAINIVQPFVPNYSKKEYLKALLQVQDELFQYGITGVHEAGIDFEHITWFKQLIKSGQLKLNLYAMLMDAPANRQFAQQNGPYRYRNLYIRSFKCFADGALGSRGALLKAPYHDHPNSRGLLLTEVARMQNLAQFCLKNGYQMNTHSIGDSANALILDLYGRVYAQNPDHRFRIEHAQVIDPRDFQKFANFAVFPSVQPTHAVSDADWAEARLGKARMKGAYAYRTLLGQFGMLAIGTDFPVEQTNPFLSIQAAVNRPAQEALTLEEVLRGMTIFAAFASFEENRLGTLEKGKDATFAIFEYPVSATAGQVQNYAYRTFIKGKCVFKLEAL